MVKHRTLLFWLAAFLGIARIEAHDPGISSAMAGIRADGSVEISVACNLGDVRAWLAGHAAANGKSTIATTAPMPEDLRRMAAHWWEARRGDERIEPAFVETSFSPDGGAVFVVTYAAGPGENLQLRAAVLAALPPGHRTYFSAVEPGGTVVAEALLEAAHDRVTIPPQKKTPQP